MYIHPMPLRQSTLRACLISSLVVLAGALASPVAGRQLTQMPTRIPSPAGAHSAEPQLSVSSRGVLLSWIERDGDTARLKFSERTTKGWTPAITAAAGTDWFVNWADVPSVMRLSNGTLAAHWLQKSASSTYAYDVRLSHSTDDGKTWSTPVTPHSDGTQTEHGFASLVELPGAKLGLIWLDGRAMTPGPEMAGHDMGAMGLRFASFERAATSTAAWKQTAESLVDNRVCECCPTAFAVTSEGPIAAFRNRSDTEVRDIHVSRLEHGAWAASQPVHADNWQIDACPVNGPAIAARGRQVAVAWFTGVGGENHAYVAFSGDAGKTFHTPIRVDDTNTLGRVDVALLSDGFAIVTWMERTASGSELRWRRVSSSGPITASATVSEMSSSRSSGYPRMAVTGTTLTFAWVDTASSTIVTAETHVR